MKTALHLVAMPLAYPLHPSSQLGYLHGFAEQAFHERVTVRSHHAFLPILHAFAGEEMGRFFEDYSLVGEEILYLACCLSARSHGETLGPALLYDQALERYNAFRESVENEAQQQLVPIDHETLQRLCEAMESYVEERLAPALGEDCLNVVGFTASFCQVFGSVFAARHLRRITDRPALFLFGGSSYSLPEGSRTLHAWGVDGLLVSGSGEEPLRQILEACLELRAEEDALAALAARRILNVQRAGAPHERVDLKMPRGYMDTLPVPEYRDYFEALRTVCQDDKAYRFACENLVSIPLEGSRGCFAKCDFCHNPNITSEFRTLSGQTVAARALALTRHYQVPDVTFVDSVSNTWAESYADCLLAQGIELKAFMELRVHAPETFWTKLALCGATALQLGIEAVSPPLLTKMRKRTTVMQNLAATKYMAELGTRNASNLIIDHPEASVADVIETQRVISLLEHFPLFNLSRFVVSYASPLYEELSEERKAQLRRGFEWMPRELDDFGWPRHLSYTWPDKWRHPAVVEAWLRFQCWYARHIQELSLRLQAPAFMVEEDGEDLVLTDSRFGREDTYRLTGVQARVYEACHQPRTAASVAKFLGLAEDVANAMLKELEERKALLATEGRFLSVALRPREVLIARAAPLLRELTSGLTPADIDRMRRPVFMEGASRVVS
jgi:radical SAM superfamily enzyme YgiQ (UPF0313 family)